MVEPGDRAPTVSTGGDPRRATRGSPRPCRRSPTRSATRPGGASTCSSATGRATTGVTAVGGRRRGRRAPERRPPPPRQAQPPAATSRSSSRLAGGRGRRTAGRPSKRYVAVAPRHGAPPTCRCTATTSCWRCSGGRSTVCRTTRRRRWPRRSAHVRAGDGRRAHRRRPARPGSARCARRCSPSPTRSRPTASPPTPTSRVATGGVDRLRIINDHCPFGAVAIDHPVICAVDRGMVRGMLGVLYRDGDPLEVATEASKAFGDTICATAV